MKKLWRARSQPARFPRSQESVTKPTSRFVIWSPIFARRRPTPCRLCRFCRAVTRSLSLACAIVGSRFSTPPSCRSAIRSKCNSRKDVSNAPSTRRRWASSRFGPTTMPRAKSSEFEKAFQELEEIVKRLESEELPLDESLQLFEKGIRLSRFCNQKLEEVEKKIELILADSKGQPVVEPFEPEEEEDTATEEGL